ncbi:hypothetical protein AKJ16_DCAP16397 [Drosera capensis]
MSTWKQYLIEHGDTATLSLLQGYISDEHIQMKEQRVRPSTFHLQDFVLGEPITDMLKVRFIRVNSVQCLIRPKQWNQLPAQRRQKSADLRPSCGKEKRNSALLGCHQAHYL